MAWLIRVTGVALSAAGLGAIGFLVYQRMGVALDLPGCALPSWRTILALDTGAMVAFVGSGFLLLRPQRAVAPARRRSAPRRLHLPHPHASH